MTSFDFSTMTPEDLTARVAELDAELMAVRREVANRLEAIAGDKQVSMAKNREAAEKATTDEERSEAVRQFVNDLDELERRSTALRSVDLKAQNAGNGWVR